MANTQIAVQDARALLPYLPKLSEHAAEVSRLVMSWDEDQTPPGMGKYGELLDWGDGVATSLIWHDEDLYCFGADDRAMVAEGEPFDNLIKSYQARQTYDENRIARTTLIAPLILVERANPANARQKLLLLWKWQPFLVAKTLKWPKVPALVYPNVSDFDIRNWGLHLRIQESAPTKAEVWRQVKALNDDAAAGRISADSGPPPNQTDMAHILGMSQEYISKLEGVFARSREADTAWRQGLIPVATAIKLCETLGAYPEVLRGTLAQLIKQPMSTTEAERFILQAKRNTAAGGVLRLVSDTTQQDGALETFKMHMGVALDILTQHDTAFIAAIGKDTTADFARHLAKMIKTINAVTA